MHAFMAAALATGVVVAGAIPVSEIGAEGWNKHGESGAFSVEFVGDDAVFTTTAEDAADKGVDMQLRRLTVSALSKYADAAIEGENAHLTLEGTVKAGDAKSRYTSIVFNTSNPDEVHFTWGGDPDTFVSTDEFFAGIADGYYSGLITVERVGHTNTADKDGETARVDQVTLKGETFDFGAAEVPTTVIPIDAVGQEGWKQFGEHADFTIGWTGDAATFTTEDGAGKVDMSLKRNVAADISKYRDAVIKGENAFLTVEMRALPSLKYTSVVFSSDNPDQVILTWGKDADERLTMAEFQDRIDSGELKGMVYSERVGHTNTADTNGEYAEVDEVSFGGTTYDFRGQLTAEGEGPDGSVTPEVETPDVEVEGPAAEGEGPEGPVMPQVTPDTETPDTETPDTETPDTETPDTETPDTETPESEGDLPQTGAGLAAALLGASLLGAGGGLTFLSRRRD